MDGWTGQTQLKLYPSDFVRDNESAGVVTTFSYFKSMGIYFQMLKGS